MCRFLFQNCYTRCHNETLYWVRSGNVANVHRRTGVVFAQLSRTVLSVYNVQLSTEQLQLDVSLSSQTPAGGTEGAAAASSDATSPPALMQGVKRKVEDEKDEEPHDEVKYVTQRHRRYYVILALQ